MTVPRYRIGDQVFASSYGRRGRVVGLGSSIGGAQYYRVDLGESSPILVRERDLVPARSPLISLANHDYGEPDDFDLLTRAVALNFAYRYEGWSCLSNARLDPKPYQVFVAHRVLQDLYPRYILADEVGLGKTIEAGLILKELKARGLANRILIITPASIREQWQGELSAKFNERFFIYDRLTIKENLRRQPRRNPWAIDDHIITSKDFARGQISDGDQDRRGWWLDDLDWDLVIIDEAHHLRRRLVGRKTENTKLYRLGQTLAEKTNSLLLLTATPMQLSTYEAFSLIELVNGNLFASYEEFERLRLNGSGAQWKVVTDALEFLGDPDLCDDDQAQAPNTLYELVDALDQMGLAPVFWKRVTDSCLRLASDVDPSIVEGEIELLRNYTSLLHNLLIAVATPVLQGIARSNYETILEVIGREPEVIRVLDEYYESFQGLETSLHPLCQVMVRNRKREVLRGEVVDRKAYKIEVVPTPEEKVLYDEVSAYIKESYARASSQKNSVFGFVLTTFRKLLVSSPLALALSLEKRANRIQDALDGGPSAPQALSDEDLAELDETVESIVDLDELFNLLGVVTPKVAQAEIAKLRDLAKRARALRIDSKAEKLLDSVEEILQDNPSEKILIFAQFRETQRYLCDLFQTRGHAVALFHSEQGANGYSKRREFERFKKSPEVRIMVSTEVGGEGLNLQFCHILFNYDLPWNPMRIEQRIGRLDRIGQTRNVHIYNFSLVGTLDARILDVLQNRIRLFEETIGNLDPILGDDIESSIREMLMADEAESERKLTDLQELAEQRLVDAREAEQAMADFVMDRASFRQDTFDRLMGRTPPVTHQAIERLIRGFFSRYPHEDLIKAEDGNVCTIVVPDRFREECKRLQGVPLENHYKGTFDPATAIEEDTIDFFAFGHPLIDAIVKYCTEYETHGHFQAQTALRVLKQPDYRGYEGLQSNYILVFRGVREYRKLVPLVLDRSGAYDEATSWSLFDADYVEDHEAEMSPSWTLPALEALNERSWLLVDQIAERELLQFQERNASDFADLQIKTARIFDYRLRNQQAELERRQERLADAQARNQTRIVPALQGQVRATAARLKELAAEREKQLAELENQEEAVLGSVKLLNMALVKVV